MEAIVIKIVLALLGVALSVFIIKYVATIIKNSGKTEALLEVERLFNKNSEHEDKIIKDAENEISKLTDAELRDAVTRKLQRKAKADS